MVTCKNCKAQLDESEKVCRYCGTPVDPFSQAEQEFFDTNAPMDPGLDTAGYSDLIDSEEVVAALKKNKRVTRIVLFIFIILPIAGFLIYGSVSSKMDIAMAAFAGVFVSAVILLSSLIVAIKNKVAKPFEGTVAEKKVTREYSGSAGNHRSRRKYIVRFDCDDGKRRKKAVSIPVYEYLQIGERVRYLPRFPQPFEKYDKRPDGAVLCMFCSKTNPLTETNCKFCHKPLIK